MKKKNLAFTLAEVLIVIGIIGVVAALTLPNLNHATGDKETVTKVKKIYSALTEAVDRAQAIYGPYDTWSDKNASIRTKTIRLADRMTDFLKISKDCGSALNAGCFSSKEVFFANGATSGASLDNWYPGVRRIITSDNVSVVFGYNSNDATRSTIYVDINGPNKGENKYGYDIFLFTISDNQLIPFPNGNDGTGSTAAKYILEGDDTAYKRLRHS